MEPTIFDQYDSNDLFDSHVAHPFCGDPYMFDLQAPGCQLEYVPVQYVSNIDCTYQESCPGSISILSDSSLGGFLPSDWAGRTPRSDDTMSMSDADEELLNREGTSVSAMHARSSRSRSLAPSMGTTSDSSWDSNRTCRDCSTTFTRVFELEEHAKDAGHKPFGCDECDRWFSRRDAWRRHADLHSSRGRHPCPWCPKYQEKRAFKRKDHLRKHLRNVHGELGCPRNIVESKLWSEKQCVKKSTRRTR